MLRYEVGARLYNIDQLASDYMIPPVSVGMLDDVSVVGYSRYPCLIGKVKYSRTFFYHSLRRTG